MYKIKKGSRRGGGPKIVCWEIIRTPNLSLGNDKRLKGELEALDNRKVRISSLKSRLPSNFKQCEKGNIPLINWITN